MSQIKPSKFEKQAANAGDGFFQEFWIFLKENKKWWLLPILLAFLLMGALLLAGEPEPHPSSTPFSKLIVPSSHFLPVGGGMPGHRGRVDLGLRDSAVLPIS